MHDLKTTEYTVFVSHISPTATPQHISDFFNFCGTVKNISLNLVPNHDGQAIVTFETEEAAKTALLLTNALIEDRPITVESYDPENKEHQLPIPQQHSTDRVVQSDIPSDTTTEQKTTGVIAPILAAGYQLGNDALSKIKEIDEKNNISKNIISATDATFNKVIELDKTLHVSSTVGNISKKVDDSLKITQNYNAAVESMASSIDSSYVKVKETPAVQTAVNNLNQMSQTVSNFFAPPAEVIKSQINEVQTQTREIIEKKEAEKGTNVHPE
eukprot:TRINITY_DN8388_c0_g1_i1.p1 TRINITY_DN8388_c0_g1~~TRINITY_DN8388_c0_g1_i1.p1  ORF type:complete len:271 (-),score=53.69 TRINITY_DN8388_c0_g1_i1:82-894(-)